MKRPDLERIERDYRLFRKPENPMEDARALIEYIEFLEQRIELLEDFRTWYNKKNKEENHE